MRMPFSEHLNGSFIYERNNHLVKPALGLTRRLAPDDRQLNDERPGRSYDRAVKSRPKRYAVRVIKKLP